jgi:hypothetical protein
MKQVTNKEQAEACSEYVMRMRAEMKSLFVNSVANSIRLSNFALSTTFGKMLVENRIFLGA